MLGLQKPKSILFTYHTQALLHRGICTPVVVTHTNMQKNKNKNQVLMPKSERGTTRMHQTFNDNENKTVLRSQ